MEEQQQLGLPRHIDRIRMTQATAEKPGTHVRVIRAGNSGFDAQVFDYAGNVLVELQGYRTVAVSGSVRTGLLRLPHGALA